MPTRLSNEPDLTSISQSTSLIPRTHTLRSCVPGEIPTTACMLHREGGVIIFGVGIPAKSSRCKIHIGKDLHPGAFREKLRRRPELSVFI